MKFKSVAVFFASFGLMAQISPSQPDDTMLLSACRAYSKFCIENYSSAGYTSAWECFDDRTGGDNCPAQEGDDHIDRVWAYYSGPIQRCISYCQ
jgi:hypothetical protein